MLQSYKLQKMKKNITLTSLLVLNLFFAQVGVNTTSPSATLDVTAKNTSGTTTNVDGLLVPRVDRQRAQSMAAVPTSTMIYVNNIITGTQTGTAVNINAVGYYYYNGTAWTKLNVDGPNLYSSNGTLTKDRIVAQGSNTLAFSGTAINAFSVDGTTLSVDAAHDKVGIQTATPQKSLHINGSLQITNELNVGGDASTAGMSGNVGQVLKSNGPGVAPTWQNLAGVPNATGTVIVANGQFIVAQEIIVQMTADFTTSSHNTTAIGNLTNEIIDNEDHYTGSASTNSFSVSADGVYQITMNGQLSTTNGTSPVIGIWDNTNSKWVARVNDLYTATTGSLQTYTLLTSIPMLAANKYSFRITNTTTTTIKHISSGSTGSGPITQMSLKRLK